MEEQLIYHDNWSVLLFFLLLHGRVFSGLFPRWILHGVTCHLCEIGIIESFCLTCSFGSFGFYSWLIFLSGAVNCWGYKKSNCVCEISSYSRFSSLADIRKTRHLQRVSVKQCWECIIVAFPDYKRTVFWTFCKDKLCEETCVLAWWCSEQGVAWALTVSLPWWLMIVSTGTKYTKLLLFLVGTNRSILGSWLLVIIAEQKNTNNKKPNQPKKPQRFKKLTLCEAQLVFETGSVTV